MKTLLDKIYIPSDNVVAREIEGEIIIIPLVSGIGDLEDELFTLNETGREIWRLLDGKRNLKQIAEVLAGEYQIPVSEIEPDVLGLLDELAGRRMVSEAETLR